MDSQRVQWVESGPEEQDDMLRHYAQQLLMSVTLEYQVSWTSVTTYLQLSGARSSVMQRHSISHIGLEPVGITIQSAVLLVHGSSTFITWERI